MLIESAAKLAAPLLNFPVIRRIRRNHGLEHATIHMLSRRVKGLKVAGHSSANGFVLIGNPSTAEVEAATREALTRLKRGENGLALHPNCGTNMVTTALLATLGAKIGLDHTGKGDRLGRAFTLVVLALIIGQPLGMLLQRHFTTEGNPGDLEIATVTRHEIKLPMSQNQITVHNITTRNG